MAVGVNFVCNHCSKVIVAWSDGNPYYFDEHGLKQYAYHPDHERLALCVGNDSPHLCLGCGFEFKVDSQAPTEVCPNCGAIEIIDICELLDKSCPECRAGQFTIDPDGYCIS